MTTTPMLTPGAEFHSALPIASAATMLESHAASRQRRPRKEGRVAR
ncbi:hypothetical protein GS532_30690 [Rhodococcus hoagii]|nr:hypothetical protein [Prescottella equi]MBM4687221.1 hypothetical protein [Prescottella equi]MBM4687859.1 hypothetical protein [Prescottella equi]NKR83186.1 hypothetical protein [Prescottella equi]NKV77925.1 hypothetical protein [Prescottella equi]